MAANNTPPSIKRDILISVGKKQTRVAIIEDNQLVELIIDQDSDHRMVGDIYKGIVCKVFPGMQAAFVDIGLPKQGFLHVSDMSNELFDDDVEQDDNAKKSPKGKSRKSKLQTIQDQIDEGQEIMVQVIKEPISTKGPRVSSDISLPGRLLVYAPYDNRLGISRKIEVPADRARIREMLKDIVTSREGVIVRTVAADTAKKDFQNEYNSLKNLWRKIRRQAGQVEAPALVYSEAKLISGLLRDIFTEKVDNLIVDDSNEYKLIKEYLKIIAPELINRLQLHKGPAPLFTSYELDDEMRRVFNKKVWLKSGGYIIIEQTEALVSIDVNTGRYTGERNQEETILRTNLDAAREIARQIRLRDLGGIIVCDFIDMETRGNRQTVLDELRRWLKFDRAKTKAFELSPLGLVEMSRQRVRRSLYQSLTETCPTCGGRGRLFTADAITGEIERAVMRVHSERKGKSLMIKAHPQVALHLMEKDQSVIAELENATGLTIQLRDDPLMRQDEILLISLPSGKEYQIVW